MNRGEDEEIDSDLNEATTRLTPEGERAVDGLIVLAEPAEEVDAPESKVAGPDAAQWSTLGSQSSYYNDAGLVPFNTVSVGGHVWLDANKDGLQAETDELVAGKEVVLERQQTTFAAARAVGWMSRVTDGTVGSDLAADGEPLVAAERYDDIQWVLDDVGWQGARRAGGGTRRGRWRGRAAWCRRAARRQWRNRRGRWLQFARR